MANKVLQSSRSRVFIISGRADPNNAPSYESCLRMTGVSQGFGDITKEECPDPYNYGQFIEVAQIRGASERVTTTLEGRYYMDILSTLLDLARQNCAVDVQLHMGICTDPSEFDTFEKAVILEEAFLTNFSTDDLGALASGDNAVVNETADISATRVYEVRRLSFSAKAASTVTNEVIDITFCDTLSCGSDCEDQSDGCQVVYALTVAAGGSPSTPADIVFSLDGGSTWYAHDIDTLSAAEEPDELACVGSYLVVVSNETGSYHYALKSEFNSYTDPTFTEVAISGGAPNAIDSIGNRAFIVGDIGYIYSLSSVATGVTELDAGSATTSDLQAVHMLSADYAVAVGDNGAVVYTTNGTDWNAATFPVGAGITLNTVWMKSETRWFVGTNDGRLFYTDNSGTTWTLQTFTGSGTGSVEYITFATDSIGYLSHTTVAPVGRLLRTYNGGNSWVVMPEDTTTLPTNQGFHAIAACSYNANKIFAAGLGAATDGIILLGSV